jgi:hypothetical protein
MRLGNEWSEVRTALKHGESLLMVRDGVLDRWGGSIDELADAIRTLRSDPSVGSPQEFAEILCKGPDSAAEAGDDSTAVMFHREGRESYAGPLRVPAGSSPTPPEGPLMKHSRIEYTAPA